MVVDEPVTEVAAGPGRRAADRRGRRGAARARGGLRRARAAASSCARSPAAGGSTPGPTCAAVRRAVRARRPAGPADPGRARDARRRRLPPAGDAGAGLGGPRRQRRRRHAHPGHPRPGRGGRARRRRAARSSTARPRYFLERLGLRGARRAARARAVPARARRLDEPIDDSDGRASAIESRPSPRRSDGEPRALEPTEAARANPAMPAAEGAGARPGVGQPAGRARSSIAAQGRRRRCDGGSVGRASMGSCGSTRDESRRSITGRRVVDAHRRRCAPATHSSTWPSTSRAASSAR